MQEMEFMSAPKHHLDTWAGLNKVVLYSSVAIVGLLLIMAATLT